VKACQLQKLPHARCVILIEACEESGSPDLPVHVNKLIEENMVGDVSLVICLDSGAGNYNTMWVTTNLRGMMMVNMKVTTLEEGIHSGDGGGIASDSFRVIRQILSAVEDEKTAVMVKDFHVDIPEDRLDETRRLCEILGDGIWSKFPLVNKQPLRTDKNNIELSLNRTWRPNITITGQDGLPANSVAGNVLRPSTTVKISMRLPPTFDHTKAFPIFERLLKAATPPDAKMELFGQFTAPGWNAPRLEPWLKTALDTASETYLGSPAGFIGEGGSIPFMGMLGVLFPKAQFVVTGVLGPQSNAHGPNEFLEIEYCKRVICCVSAVVASHGSRMKK